MNQPMASSTHAAYMQKALLLAEAALQRGEFPVGCIMVYEGRILASGERRGTRRDIPSELDHAEMVALRQLETTGVDVDPAKITVYATLEPCLMCFGAMLIRGIGTIVYAYEDAMGGGTACRLRRLPPLYSQNQVDIIAGIGREESLALFKQFFSHPDTDYWRDSLLANYTLDQP